MKHPYKVCIHVDLEVNADDPKVLRTLSEKALVELGRCFTPAIGEEAAGTACVDISPREHDRECCPEVLN